MQMKIPALHDVVKHNTTVVCCNVHKAPLRCAVSKT